MGNAALFSNTTGVENTAVGASALRSLWAVRISPRELRPNFEAMYLNHFAEPEQAFEAMRYNLLDGGRQLADLAHRLRAESSR